MIVSKQLFTCSNTTVKIRKKTLSIINIVYPNLSTNEFECPPLITVASATRDRSFSAVRRVTNGIRIRERDEIATQCT